MKLDRNNPDGRGKYALLKLRKLDDFVDPNDPFKTPAKPIAEALRVLEDAGILDWGNTPETEFFVMKLKDQSAGPALYAYYADAINFDEEYAEDILQLAGRAGLKSPFCKRPD